MSCHVKASGHYLWGGGLVNGSLGEDKKFGRLFVGKGWGPKIEPIRFAEFKQNALQYLCDLSVVLSNLINWLFKIK